MKRLFKNLSKKVIIRFIKGDIKANIANSFLRRTIGLSFRPSLNKQEGLFFIFPVAVRPIFWNFGMRFPIDIIWINKSNIVGIEKNISKMTSGLKILRPPVKIDSALEISSGSADAMGVKIGDIISFIYEK